MFIPDVLAFKIMLLYVVYQLCPEVKIPELLNPGIFIHKSKLNYKFSITLIINKSTFQRINLN